MVVSLTAGELTALSALTCPGISRPAVSRTVTINVKTSIPLAKRPPPPVVAARVEVLVTVDFAAEAIAVVTVMVVLPVLFDPSWLVAVIVVVPGPVAVTTPDWFTVATVVSDDAHVKVWFVALLGVTVAVSVVVSPTVNPAVDGLSVTDVTRMTGLGLSVTVMVALPDLFDPSWAVAVIVVVPEPTAVTTPDWFTVATVVSDDAHVRT